MSGPFRPQPLRPAHAYQTYSIASPLSTHTRPATCDEVECEGWRNGWITTIDLTATLPNGMRGTDQADYIRARSGRVFTETRAGDTIVRFVFPPGQRCFAAGTHRISLERPEVFIRRGGDWRGNPRGDQFIHSKPEHWVEDCAEHLDRLATEIGKG